MTAHEINEAWEDEALQHWLGRHHWKLARFVKHYSMSKEKLAKIINGEDYPL